MPVLPRRLVVFGAAAPLGGPLLARLARHPDLDVLAADRLPALAEAPPGVSYAVVPHARPTALPDPETVRRLLLDTAPHTVVYLTGFVDAARCEAARTPCHAATAETAEALARACRHVGARFVVHSSDLVFDGRAPGFFAEADRPAARSFAARCHLAMENTARGAGEGRWAVLRTGPLFGLRRSSDLFARALALDEPPGDGPARPYTAVHDAAHALERLLRSPLAGVVHVAGHAVLTPEAFARHARAAAGLAAPPTASTSTPGTGLVTLRAETLLGLRPTPLADALDALVRELQDDA